MFVVNPNEFLLPLFGITPFKTEYVAINHLLPENNEAKIYFDNKFGIGNWHYTYNGREAIKLALETYKLDKNDVVTILTTSENFYISSCVTLEIEAVCKWNRAITQETKLIFVNHEFGYPYPNMEKLVALGLPIIEDCCTTFFSQDQNQKIGKYGDFAVYSLPKFFPMQIGGIVVSNKGVNLNSSILNAEQKQYIQNVMSYNLIKQDEILAKRKENFEYGLQLFSKLGFSERFKTYNNVVPSTLLLNNNGLIKDLNKLKLFLSNHGIQSSVFYGEDAFFIPIHQNLTFTDLDYFSFLISFFITI